MNIGVVGVNHNLAPINVREAVSFTDTKKIEAINILLDREIDEIVILSTCNRSEIYISGENIQQKVDEVANFYKDYFGVKDIEQYLFKKTNLEAIQHLFDVTAGLDSLVVGEDQILGQVKDAHEFCMKLGATKKVFNKLFRDAVTTSKEIKTITKISQQPLSISYIGVKLLKEKMGTLEGKNALIVGLGKMNLLTLNHLEEENVKNIAQKLKNDSRKYDNDIFSSLSFNCHTIETACLITLLELIKHDTPIYVCKNCGKYFIPSSKKNTLYCNNIYEHGKTCQEIGAMITYNEKLKKDEINSLYRKTLSAKKMLANRNPDIPMYLEKYEKWKNEANKFKKDIKQGLRTEEEFLKWIEETRKK